MSQLRCLLVSCIGNRSRIWPEKRGQYPPLFSLFGKSSHFSLYEMFNCFASRWPLSTISELEDRLALFLQHLIHQPQQLTSHWHSLHYLSVQAKKSKRVLVTLEPHSRFKIYIIVVIFWDSYLRSLEIVW